MRAILKQVAGIDVAQNELVVCLARMREDLSTELFACKTFSNTPSGFSALVGWAVKHMDATVSLRYVMEATGVYHEAMAWYLAEQGLEVSIVLPSKISHYVRTLETKTITDKTAAQAIARFAVERTLQQWQPPKDLFERLRGLTRERGQIVEQTTMIKNQLHAEEKQARPLKTSVQRMKKRLMLLERQQKEILSEIKELLHLDQEVQELVEVMCSIPGVGLLTAATVLAETNGFDLIKSRRQLASYAGFDVQEKQSGTSVKGKARISKKGNRYLRKAMYLPALSLIRHDEGFKAFFNRLAEKHGIKMKAVVAVQRKLLELIYTLHKTKQPYCANYLQKSTAQAA